MVTITEIKQKMLDKMSEMDMDQMTLFDAGQYVTILRTLSEITEKTYHEALVDAIQTNVFRPTVPEPIRLGNAQGGV